MKAKIGKHVHWFSVQRVENRYLEWRHGKHCWDIDDRDYDALDRFVVKFLDHWQTVLYYTVNKIQSVRQRKVQVHLDPWDSWNADDTLAHVILPVLEQLRDTQHGSPFVDLEDVPKELHGKKLSKKQRDNGELDDKHHERWQYVLDAMIWSFQEIADDYPGEEEFISGEFDVKWSPVDREGNAVAEKDRGYYRMDYGPNHTSTFDSEGYDRYYNRIRYGTMMFGKYFRSLWD